MFGNATIESRDLVLDVDATVNNSDPAAAQEQAASVHGDSDPGIKADATVVLEDILVGNDGGDDIRNEADKAQYASDSGVSVVKATASMFGQNRVTIWV